jgi:UDP-N-acetylglucosamine--N-acetylmuramyl-(pentapeptide) pyrophosphoryl-undecaprenol N-acetylglucosamine transferase
MITGGGTGGHTSPAVAVYEELAKRDGRLVVQWVGRAGAIEERVSAALGVPFRPLPVAGWPRGLTLKRGWVAAKMGVAVARAWVYLKRFQPQVVFGVGGYVSLPLMWAAQRAGIPTVLHEQNRLLGAANRILAPRAARILLSFPDTIGEIPTERASVVGNPVRAAFLSPLDQRPARARFGLDPDTPVVLVSGGSQGAQSINRAVADALSRFSREQAQFLWMAGSAGVAAAREAARLAPVRVEVFPFIEDMAGACAAADLIVGRAGASSTAEIAMLHKPSILIPFPHATDNHQEHNARSFAEAGAAVLLEDVNCTGESLVRHIAELLGDRERLEQMGRAAGKLARPGAAESIADEILQVVFSDDRANDGAQVLGD